jgi:membrane associated rhomboid family serine protease
MGFIAFIALPGYLCLMILIGIECPTGAENKMRKKLRFALLAVAILWGVYMFDLLLPIDLRFLGLLPRSPDRLWGILTYPFLHANFQHLAANTAALFPLLIVSLSYSRRLTHSALIIIYLLTGILVWLFGRGNGVHIGVSGIIFGLIGFLMFLGVFRRDWTALGVSVVIGLLYGGALLTLFTYIPAISWSSHFFGFLSGVLAAWWMKRGRIR